MSKLARGAAEQPERNVWAKSGLKTSRYWIRAGSSSAVSLNTSSISAGDVPAVATQQRKTVPANPDLNVPYVDIWKTQI
jgi:hypothetical protein